LTGCKKKKKSLEKRYKLNAFFPYGFGEIDSEANEVTIPLGFDFQSELMFFILF
jgi:hypothetical protein